LFSAESDGDNDDDYRLPSAQSSFSFISSIARYPLYKINLSRPCAPPSHVVCIAIGFSHATKKYIPGFFSSHISGIHEAHRTVLFCTTIIQHARILHSSQYCLLNSLPLSNSLGVNIRVHNFLLLLHYDTSRAGSLTTSHVTHRLFIALLHVIHIQAHNTYNFR
jgi:hypothetical protein